MLAWPAAARLLTLGSASVSTSSAVACAAIQRTAASTVSRSCSRVAPRSAADAAAGDVEVGRGHRLDRGPGPFVRRRDPDDALPHLLPPVGGDVPEERAPREQLEGRVQHERVGRIALRDRDGACGEGEQALVGQLGEAAAGVLVVDVVRVDAQRAGSRRGEVGVHGRHPKTST